MEFKEEELWIGTYINPNLFIKENKMYKPNTEHVKLIDRSTLYLDSEGDKGTVSLYDISEAMKTTEGILNVLATISSISYGNTEATNNRKLVENLVRMKHYSVFEFIRVPSRYGIETSMRNYIEHTNNLDTAIDIVKELNNRTKYIFNDSCALFLIKVPIFSARQLMRHRAFSYCEMSRRRVSHKKVPFTFYYPEKFEEKTGNDPYFLIESTLEDYFEMLEEYPYEIARAVLPQNTYTYYWMIGNSLSYNNLLEQRLDKHAQGVSREVAVAIKELLDYNQPNLLGG